MTASPLSRFLLATLLCAAAVAHAAETKLTLNIQAQPVREALQAFGEQTGLQVLFRSEGVSIEGMRTPAVSGQFSAREALDRLLANSGLHYEFVNDRTVRIASPTALQQPVSMNERGEPGRGFMRLAVVDESTTSPAAVAQTQQDNKANPAEPGSTAIDEVIVTANRRAESLQDVSASVTAITDADIQRKGFDGFEDFAATVPGMTYFQPVRNFGVMNIRGLALSISGGNQQLPVSVYINDAPVVDTFGAIVTPDLRLFDVERIEVLRGPQGTLFGSGSLGGTVRVITNRPDPTQVKATGRVDYGATDGGGLRQRYDGMVNIPLIEDKMALRVVGYYRDEEGWVRNTTLGIRNDSEEFGGRLAWLWKPTDAFSLRAELFHQDSDPKDGDRWDPTLGKFRKTSTIGEGRKAVLTNYSLTADYVFDDFATLTSVSTYHKTEANLIQDLGDLFGLGVPYVSKSNPWDTKYFVQELRLVSNTDSRFEWVAGAFFQDRKTSVDYLIEFPGIDDLFGGIIGTDGFFISPIVTKGQELAGYGDVTFKMTDKLRFNLGARVFRTEASYEEKNRRVLNFATLQLDASSLYNEASDTNSTWRAGISYDFGDALLYANVTKGFRIGQVNPNSGPSTIDPNDVVIAAGYGPDSTINYEVGAKTTWLNGRVAADIVAYYIDWKDIQIDGSRISDRLAYIANAGTATSKGVEFELSARPTNGLTFYTTLTFQDAEMDSVPQNIILPAAAGDELPGLVKFKFSGGVQYEWNVGADKRMYVRADGQHVGKSPNALADGGANLFLATNEAYDNIDAAIGMMTSWGEIALYGENLTNNDSLILKELRQGPNSVTTLRPLTGGVRVTVRY